MKHSLKWNRNKTTRNNFLTYGVVIFLFSFALSACVNKVTSRDTLEF